MNSWVIRRRTNLSLLTGYVRLGITIFLKIAQTLCHRFKSIAAWRHSRIMERAMLKTKVITFTAVALVACGLSSQAAADTIGQSWYLWANLGLAAAFAQQEQRPTTQSPEPVALV